MKKIKILGIVFLVSSGFVQALLIPSLGRIASGRMHLPSARMLSYCMVDSVGELEKFMDPYANLFHIFQQDLFLVVGRLQRASNLDLPFIILDTEQDQIDKEIGRETVIARIDMWEGTEEAIAQHFESIKEAFIPWVEGAQKNKMGKEYEALKAKLHKKYDDQLYACARYIMT